jgi:hypothetical protein
MTLGMWKARNKIDLIIEVWEKLDCESVGEAEIRSIEAAVEDVYGKSAVDSPMIIARLLADEGAELRHSEIMKLYLERAADRPHDAAMRNILETSDLAATLRSIRNMENLRRKLASDNDKDGLRRLRQEAIEEKDSMNELAQNGRVGPTERAIAAEIAEWLRLWLQSPELFENWIGLRRRSEEFVSRFGEF